jgi:hypothetical protein
MEELFQVPQQFRREGKLKSKSKFENNKSSIEDMLLKI